VGGDSAEAGRKSGGLEVTNPRAKLYTFVMLSASPPGTLQAGVEIDRHLRHEANSVALARRSLKPLESAVDPDTFETLRLLVSELVTNSLCHGRGEDSADIELSVSASRERIRVEVSDGGLGFSTTTSERDADQGSASGLDLVKALSDRWGTEGNGRMCVWCELVDSGAFALSAVG
jgi:anti-sigma regulatory factor (Ser/Thr protein kinase)